MNKYGVLGVHRSASPQELKNAYQARALATHPDKHASSTEAVKREVSNSSKVLCSGRLIGVYDSSTKYCTMLLYY